MMPSSELLFVEPRQPASPIPLIDHITRRMCAAFRLARTCDSVCCGYHRCVCGALSADHNFHLPNGDLTNSLCVHYVAYHRSEVPREELVRIEAFNFGEVEPTPSELERPRQLQKQLQELKECPEELRQSFKELDAQIEALNQEKHAAVAAFDFERAVVFRNQADRLRAKKEIAISKWLVLLGDFWCDGSTQVLAEKQVAE